jgi:hypothetical protein
MAIFKPPPAIRSGVFLYFLGGFLGGCVGQTRGLMWRTNEVGIYLAVIIIIMMG